MERILETIQPGLTILAALLATFWGSIRLFWFFFMYEKDLRQENLEKVKDLNGNYRKKHIENRIATLMKQMKTEGYLWGFNVLSEGIYSSGYDIATGATTKVLKTDAEIQDIVDSLDKSEISAQAQKDAEEYLYTDTGQSLFTTLDFLYIKKNKINSDYKRIKLFCRITYWCCLLVMILSIVGMIMQFIANAAVIVHLWFFTFALTLLLGVASFFLLLYFRNSLNENWENQFLYGDE